uniref:TVP38/TMEM64 family membrane protein n=1 Tax=Schlesneria paludicola TaxID=360056 RepID=A0A7C2K0C6_9PLAN
MAARETQLRWLIAEQPLLMYAAAFVVYVAVTGLSLPGATVLTLTYGWLFGFWRCLVLVSFASTTGATVAFLLSRFLFREAIQSQFGDRLEKFNEALRREGAFYLFTLRLVPQVPFFVINAVMGLTPLPTWTFWWVSQVGMLPGTAVYTWAGASVKDLRTLAERGVGELLTPQLFAAFLVLGLFPWIVKWLVAAFRKSTSSTAANHPPPG